VRLLVVEDDRRLCDVIRRGLTEQGHVVDLAHDGPDGERHASAGIYDAAIMDVNLPGRDGLSIIRSLRQAGNRVPVLVLTSRDTVDDVIEGLNAGADDYLRKPFVFGELDARLRSLVRRSDGAPTQELRCGDLRFDLATRQAWRGEREIVLTAREAAFLEFFLRNAGRVVTRRMLDNAMFDRDSDAASNVVDVYVSRLRAKTAAKGERQLLHTVRGIGYRLSER
jgi:two-component system, OmpR family, response regulator